MALTCASITLHKFMLCPGPSIGPTGEFLFFVLFCYCSIPRGLRPRMTFCSAPTWRVGVIHWTACFVLVISFTLHLENFLISLMALVKLNKICEALGSGFEPLGDGFFFPLLWEQELCQVEYIVFW